MERMEGGLCSNPELTSGLPRSPAMHGGGENLLRIEDEVGNDACRRCHKIGCWLHPEDTDTLIDDNVDGLEQVEGTCCAPSDAKEVYLHGGNDDGTADEERRKVEDYDETVVVNNICNDARGKFDNCKALLDFEEISILGNCKVGGIDQLQGDCSRDIKGAYILGGINDTEAEKEGGDLETYDVGFMPADQESKDLVGNKFCNDAYCETDKCKILLAPEENNILVHNNRSALEQVDGVRSPPSVDKGISFFCRSDDGIADKESRNAEDSCMGFIAAKQETDHNKQQIFVNVPDLIISENDSSAHMDPEITNCIPVNCSLRCENGYGSVEADISSYKREMDVKAPRVFDGDGCHNSHLADVTNDLKPGFGEEVVSFSASERSSSQKSHYPISISHGPDLLVTTCVQGSNSDSINILTSNNIDMLEGEYETKATHQKPGPLLVFRRTKSKRGASSMNNQTDIRSDQLLRKRNVVRICTKGVDASKSNLTTISSTVSRKRSNTHRIARHSIWGGAANLVSIFKQTGKLSNCDSYFIQSQTGKVKKRSAKKKQETVRDTCCRKLKIRCSVSTNPKDKIFQKPASTDFVDIQHDSFPKLDATSVSGDIIGVRGTVNKFSEDKFASDIKTIQHGDKDLESTLTQDSSNDNMLGEFPGVASHVEEKTLVEAVDKGHMFYLGSSPDSDVYNPITDMGFISCEAVTERIGDAETNPSMRAPEIAMTKGHHATDLKSSTSSLQTASYLDIPPQQIRRAGKKDNRNSKSSRKERSISEHSFCKDNLHDSEVPNRNTENKIRACSTSIGGFTKNGSSQKIFSDESAKKGQLELENHQDSRKLNCDLEKHTVSENDEMQAFEDKPVLPIESKGAKLSRSKKRGSSKGKSSSAVSSRYTRKGPNHQSNKTAGKSHKIQNEKISAPDIDGEDCKNISLSSRTASETSLAGSSALHCHQQATIDMSHGVEEPSLQSQRAWVQCDNCHKWRAISTELADFINEMNSRWICKDNSVTEFASCSIPQEMSNEEINAELGISDESCDEDISLSLKNNSANANSKPPAQSATWTPIRSNLYLHRSRRSQTIDEIMVCNCKPPTDGSLGCGDSCLNRLLSIECVKGTCPCGDLCSNQQFQKRKYAKLKWVRCGKKGFGLQLLEDVSCGQFLIEYIGEVLDLATYEARQRYYASKGHKHFYFMTLNGGEVIDAYAKGNLGRFVNHSCSPNCQTEKWMVNGEVCIGLFTLRDMKKGEEVTFDYNYEKVVGAASKKCLCGSSSCQGYIGGGENSSVVVQEDSDSEDPEPLMVHEDSEIELDPGCELSDANHSWTVKDKEISHESLLTRRSPATPLPENSEQPKHILRPECVVNPSSLGNVDLTEFTESEEPKPMSRIQVAEISPIDCAEDMGTRPLSDVKLPNLPVSNAAFKKSMPYSMVKDSNIPQSFTTKQKEFAESSHSDGKKKRTSKLVVPQRHKKESLRAHNDNLTGVEKELSNLLDLNGGISKGKGSTRGYLKLLFVTAAEGDDVGGSSKSIRDLSLILDALLKTKSRTVLMDIINKNGLQMLHNIMKQNRSKFNRTPIIRKLLKVLEFLVLREILTPEHMSKGPPCSGVESFRESMLALTRHDDIQVHQIARNFRDKWLPRKIRSYDPPDRDNCQSNFQRSNCCWFLSSIFGWQLDQGTRGSDAIVCFNPMVNQPGLMMFDVPGQVDFPPRQSINSSSSLTGNNLETRSTTRKRKSRWDQVADISGHLPSQDKDSDISFKLRKTTTLEVKKTKSDESACIEDSVLQDIDNEAPPGFESLAKDNCAAAPEKLNLEDDVAVGYLQERYLSHSSISNGMPLTFVQQPGNIEVADKIRYQEHAVAPSMPFHPFPHLPLYQELPVAPRMPFHPFPPVPPYPWVNPMLSAPYQESSDMIIANSQNHNQSKLKNG